jgi:hypothetical protein
VADFTPGDVVVLKSGSMRMLVERVDEDGVAVIWANEGHIGRDVLPVFALNKWEERKWEDRPQRDDRPAPRPWAPRPPRDDAGAEGGDSRPPRPFGGPKPGGKPPFKKPFGAKPFGGGDRAGGAKPYGDRPARTGMDGKPKAKNFYRKEE